MRITKISVKKLFGVFDHEIPLNQESRITIIHGPNGVGKTVLLRMVHGLFTSKYGVFHEVPFDRFSIHFTNGEALIVHKPQGPRQMRLPDSRPDNRYSEWVRTDDDIEISYIDSQGHRYPPYRPSKYHDNVRQIIELEHSNLDLERIGSNKWRSLITGSVFSGEEAVDYFDMDEELWIYEIPDWLTTSKNEIHTRLIETQRLQVLTGKGSSSDELATNGPLVTVGSSVERYSGEIATKMRTARSEFGQKSRQIDNTFPARLMDSGTVAPMDQEMLHAKLNELEAKSMELTELGLLEKHVAPEISNLGRIQEDLSKVLSVYVTDNIDKLAFFDPIATRLRTLASIVNECFRHKSLWFDNNKGFVILSPDEERIPISSLSSGEQHLLVLFYELLFETLPTSLVMIDEPEMSLHLNWQERFLDDIQRISQLRKFDVLMATHSPDIISDKHEWMVSLGEEESA